MADLLERLKAALSDRYTIERVLGVGGMATVYLGEDVRHHRKVAVKVLRSELAAALVDAVRILRDVVDALTEAHAHGVVHRDIIDNRSPCNVLRGGSGWLSRVPLTCTRSQIFGDLYSTSFCKTRSAITS